MDCLSLRPALIAHHFGTCDEAERELIDAHLCACQDCLRAYLAIKRAAEALPPEIEAQDQHRHRAARPSQVLRLRLRAEVAQTFRRTLLGQLRQALGRPVPLYQAVAAVALLLVVGLLSSRSRQTAVAVFSQEAPPFQTPLPARAPRLKRAEAALEIIDTARPEAASLSIF